MLFIPKENWTLTARTHLTIQKERHRVWQRNTKWIIFYIGSLTHMQTHTSKCMYTVYLTAEAAHAGLADHTEQLWLSGMLVAQEAYARFVIDAHKAGVRCRKWSTSLKGRVNGQINSCRQRTVATNPEQWSHDSDKLQVSHYSRRTFLLSVWQSCWPSWSALHLPGHHRGPCLLELGHLPGKKGTVMEGAVPRCKTMFEGHGAHRSDRVQPGHSSEREKRSF